MSDVVPDEVAYLLGVEPGTTMAKLRDLIKIGRQVEQDCVVYGNSFHAMGEHGQIGRLQPHKVVINVVG